MENVMNVVSKMNSRWSIGRSINFHCSFPQWVIGDLMLQKAFTSGGMCDMGSLSDKKEVRVDFQYNPFKPKGIYGCT